MPEDKKESGAQPLNEGYVPFKKGHQPTEGNLNTSKPPKGGSGVPPKDSSSGGDRSSGKN